MIEIVSKTNNPNPTTASPLRLVKAEDQEEVTEIDDFAEVDRQRRINRSKTFAGPVDPDTTEGTLKALEILLEPGNSQDFTLESPEEIKKLLQSVGCFKVQQLIDSRNRIMDEYLKDQLPEGVESWEKVWQNRLEQQKEIDKLKLENARLEHELAETKAGLEGQYQTTINNLTKVCDGIENRAQEYEKRYNEAKEELSQFRTKYYETNDRLEKLIETLYSQIRIIGGDRYNHQQRAGADAVDALKLKTDVEPWVNKDDRSKTAEDFGQTAMYHAGAASAIERVQGMFMNIADKAKKKNEPAKV